MEAILKKPLAYSYVRMSTDLQLKGDSLRRQTELSKKYAEEHGLELVKDFKLHDIGVSAFKGDNIDSGALGRFLNAVKIGEVPRGSYLLVESFDRLSRQKIDISVGLFFELTQNGVNLVTLADNQVFKAGDTQAGQLIMSIVVMARANEESEIKSKRLVAAWEQKRKGVESRKLTSIAPAWLTLPPDRKAFDVIAERAAVVRRIFEESASGFGTFLITRRLNSDGVGSFGRSAGWIQSYVTKILANRAVLGEYQPHTMSQRKRTPQGEAVPNYFPQIVSEDLFLRSQFARGQRRLKGGGRKGNTLRNLFTKIAKCGYCQSSMQFLNKGTGPKGGMYLQCSAAVRGAGCECTTWRYKDFERSFFSFAREIDLPSILEASARKSDLLQLDEQHISLTEKKRGLELLRERTFQLLSNDGLSIEFLTSKLKSCEADIIKVSDELDSVDAKRSKIRQQASLSPGAIQKLIDQLQTTPDADAFSQRMLLSAKLREMVTSLQLFPDGTRPTRQKVLEMLEAAGSKEIDQLMTAVDHASQFGKRGNRTFEVTMADGICRRVVLEENDPTKFVAEVVIESTGDVRGSYKGINFEEMFD